MTVPAQSQPITPREAVIDALYRAVNGLDAADLDLFQSAFTEDANFTIQGKTSSGLKAIIFDCYNNISKLDTTHFVSNPRVDIQGSTAKMTATTLAQHYPSGKGMTDAPRLLAGALYELDMVESGNVWKIKEWNMRLIWSEGDFGVLSPTSDS